MLKLCLKNKPINLYKFRMTLQDETRAAFLVAFRVTFQVALKLNVVFLT